MEEFSKLTAHTANTMLSHIIASSIPEPKWFFSRIKNSRAAYINTEKTRVIIPKLVSEPTEVNRQNKPNTIRIIMAVNKNNPILINILGMYRLTGYAFPTASASSFEIRC
jgi:hypothetical protein